MASAIQSRPLSPLSSTGHTNWIFGLAFHPDGTRIASAGADGTVRLWETAGGREILTLRGHHDRVHGVAFSPNGAHLASASADGVVRIWATELGDELERKNATFSGFGRNLSSLLFDAS